MSPIIADRAPHRPGGAVLAARLLQILGSTLIVIGGAIIVTGAVVALANLVDLLASGDGPMRMLAHVPPRLRPYLWTGWLLLASGLGAGAVGLECLSIRRRRVLFLRRFGRTDATATVSRAARKLGPQWRLITLDDSDVAAIGVRGPFARRLGFTVSDIVDGLAETALSLTTRVAVASFIALLASGAVLLIADVAWASVVFRLCLFGLGACGVSLGVWLPLVFLGELFSDIYFANERRAEKISNDWDLSSVCKRLAYRKEMFSARLSVMTVESTIWRTAVLNLSKVSTLPLIDVSEPSDAVLWEVEHMLASFGRRCVFVADEAALSALLETDDPGMSRLSQLLGSHPIYAYPPTGQNKKRFTRTLRAALEHHHRLSNRSTVVLDSPDVESAFGGSAARPAATAAPAEAIAFSSRALTGGRRPWGMRRSREGSAEKVCGIAATPDGNSLVVARRARVEIWEVRSGRAYAQFDEVRVENADFGATVESVVIAPDGSWIASTGRFDENVRIWETTTGRQRLILRGPAWVSQMAVAPGGAWLATAGFDNNIRLWDVSDGREIATLIGHSKPVIGIAIAPDGTWLASAGDDRTIRIWDPDGRRELAVLASPAPSGNRHLTTGMVAAGAVAISPDGSLMATAIADTTVRLWNTQAFRQVVAFTGSDRSLYRIVIAPDNTWLAASSERVACVWSIHRTAEPVELSGHTDKMTTMTIAPDGSWLATGSLDTTVLLWRVNR